MMFFFYSFKLWIRFCFPSDKVGDIIISEIEFSCFGDVGYSKVTSTTATKMWQSDASETKKKKKERKNWNERYLNWMQDCG